MMAATESELLGEVEDELAEEQAELETFFPQRAAIARRFGENAWGSLEFETPRGPASRVRVPSVDPVPSLAVYADLATKILRERKNKNLGIVLSMVLVSSGDTADLIDRRTERRTDGHLYLMNPPARVVMPPRVYEIEWKPGGRNKPQKIQFVWTLSNEKSTFPVGGILFLSSPGGINSFLLATFNTGSLDEGTCTNAHHAEMHATGVFPDRKGFIQAQPKTWRERVWTIDILNLSTKKKGLGYTCCDDLATFLGQLKALRGYLRRASITWLTLYDRNKPCQHPTEPADLRKLARSGWELKGPGWPVGGALAQPQDSRCTPVGTRVGNFTCSNAEIGAIQAFLGRQNVTTPALRAAVEAAAGRAVSLATRAADALDRLSPCSDCFKATRGVEIFAPNMND
jgi:hypothetical protein